MAIQSEQKAGKLTISLDEKFNFSEHKAFRESYESSPSNCNFIVDFSKTRYLDSSALGMLLLLREHADSDKSRRHLINCNQDILGILSIARFEMLFTINSRKS